MADKILVTGSAGFIGFYLCKRLLEQGAQVVGVDNLNDYYDVRLKLARLELLIAFENFSFIKGDIADSALVDQAFEVEKPGVVVNLAAQAGVRYSLTNPDAYIRSNIQGFYTILESCRRHPVRHLVYASSSSVYGANQKVPFEESDCCDQPVSLYAATKKSNELLAFSYSYLYGIPATGLRFFTVYGPMGRPDMSYYVFAQRHFAGEAIEVYNNGNTENDMLRDFTYIDDIIDGTQAVLDKPPQGDTMHRILNIGNNKPEKLTYFIACLEQSLTNALGREVRFEKVFSPLKAGDVPATFASVDAIRRLTGFEPRTSIKEGLQKFSDWFVKYHSIKL